MNCQRVSDSKMKLPATVSFVFVLVFTGINFLLSNRYSQKNRKLLNPLQSNSIALALLLSELPLIVNGSSLLFTGVSLLRKNLVPHHEIPPRLSNITFELSKTRISSSGVFNIILIDNEVIPFCIENPFKKSK